MGVYEDRATFGASLKWPSEELQFLVWGSNSHFQSLSVAGFQTVKAFAFDCNGSLQKRWPIFRWIYTFRFWRWMDCNSGSLEALHCVSRAVPQYFSAEWRGLLSFWGRPLSLKGWESFLGFQQHVPGGWQMSTWLPAPSDSVVCNHFLYNFTWIFNSPKLF